MSNRVPGITQGTICVTTTGPVLFYKIKKNVKVRSHLTSTSTFASNFNILSMEPLTLMQRMGTEPILLRLRFVTTVSIIFENANSDV